MQDVLKEYGPALITVVAIIALITVISFLIGHDSSSIVGKAFGDLIESFFTQAENAAGVAGSVSGAVTGGGE